MLIPDILSPRPRAKLFTLSASASEIASLTSILPEPFVSAVLLLINISS